MFLFPPSRLCFQQRLVVLLSISNMTQKVLEGFDYIFQEMSATRPGTSDRKLEPIRKPPFLKEGILLVTSGLVISLRIQQVKACLLGQGI